MNVALILKLIPWSMVKSVVFAVLDMIVEDSDNEIDNTILEVAKKTLGKAECEHPDED
jgi:hypothetical protein